MKNILMITLGMVMTLGTVAAQPKIATGSNIGRGRPAKVVVVRPYAYSPYRFGYNPFYSPFYYGYNPFFYGPYSNYREPSKLDLEIEQISNDYRHEIAEVRHDETLSKSERKQKIRDLRHERQNSILEAKKTYYDSKERNNG